MLKTCEMCGSYRDSEKVVFGYLDDVLACEDCLEWTKENYNG